MTDGTRSVRLVVRRAVHVTERSRAAPASEATPLNGTADIVVSIAMVLSGG